MKSARDRKSERADARGGTFFLLPQCLLSSPAFRTASPRAVKVLLALCAKHTGFNNGAIALGFRELGKWLDSQNHKANCQALCELIERGLVALERDYPKGQRLAREYRLTFVAAGNQSATNDYLDWRPGDAGTRRKRDGRNLRVRTTATRGAIRAELTETASETSRCNDRNGQDGKQPILASPPVAIAATHIVYQLGSVSRAPRLSPSNTSGLSRVAPDPGDLRCRVLAVLNDAARGSQGRLAAMAMIRPPALSKFLRHDGPLNDQARIRLTLALPKLGAARSTKEGFKGGMAGDAATRRRGCGAELSSEG